MADPVLPEIIQIKSLPGVKRDGTRFEGDNYVDGQWMRFQRGLPRKIGGYRTINKYLREISRALHAYTRNNLTYVHSGSRSRAERFYIDPSNNTSITTDRTPLTLTEDDENDWQFTADHDSDGVLQLIAQVAPNLANITNSTGGQLFYGDLFGTDRLVPITNLPATYSITGGVAAFHPYTMAFGNDGFIMWSVPSDPTDFTGTGSGNAYVTAQKIVAGLPLRGGPGNAPSGLFWSADSLIRASWVGGTQVFQFDTITSQSSILSSGAVIEYDGVFYWPGVDRFLMFNGVVREVPNNLNINWFFDGLNVAYRQKVFAIKVPRYGEIWWCYPRGDATECTHAVMYNVREDTWYDTALPNSGRSTGVFPTVFTKPLMTGVDPVYLDRETRVTEAGGTRVTEDGDARVTEQSDAARYKLWIHEEGVDEIDGQSIQPIKSWFETADVSLPVLANVNKSISVRLLEPDFVQSGPLTVRVKGRANARSGEVTEAALTIPEIPSIAQEQVNFFKTQRRQLRFYFESNAIGGDYQFGLTLAHVTEGDSEVLGGVEDVG